MSKNSGLNKDRVGEILQIPEISDFLLGYRKIAFWLFDTASIEKPSEGLYEKIEPDEEALIKEAVRRLTPDPESMEKPVNVEGLFSIVKDEYERFREKAGQLTEKYFIALYSDSQDEGVINHKRELISEALKNPSNVVLKKVIRDLVDENISISGENYDPIKHDPVFLRIIKDFNPGLGYLVAQDNHLTIKDVLKTVIHEPIEYKQVVKFNKHTELSKNVMQTFIYKCLYNDEVEGQIPHIDNIERAMMHSYGQHMFGYTPEEVDSLTNEMMEEDVFVGHYAMDFRRLKDVLNEERNEENLNDTDMDSKVRQRIRDFSEVISYAFQDMHFTPQEDILVRKVAKYFGIRSRADYDSIIEFHKKKVMIANGNSAAASALKDFVQDTSVSAYVESIDTPDGIKSTLDEIGYLMPDIVIVDLRKGDNAKELISRIRTETPSLLFIFGYTHAQDKRRRDELIREFGVTECVTFASEIKERVHDYLFMNEE